MRVVIGCEMSGVVRRAFRALGHEAWSCDILPSLDNSEYHHQGDLMDLLVDTKGYWDLAIFHPPCTYITNAGVRHLHSIPSRNGKVTEIHGERRWEELKWACNFFRSLQLQDIPKICVENPIPHKYAVNHPDYPIGKYTQLIQPWQFGHGETKATCLWLKNLPKLQPTNIVEGRKARIHLMGPSKDRSMLRSLTYSGIAEAFATQWGCL